jgi:hypothetical protein
LPYALSVLEGKAGYPGANEEAFVAAIVDRQRQRVEEFARSLFQIPIETRREQWLRLKADCAGVPALTQRLDRLEPGLALDPNGLAIADPNVGELVVEASKIFVLRPIEAAAARAAFFRKKFVSTDGTTRWGWPARNLRTSYPQYCVLAPEFIEQVFLWRTRAAELQRRRSLLLTIREATVQRAAVPAMPPPVKSQGKPPYWIIYVLLALVGAVVRLISSANSYTNTNSISPPPNRFITNEFKNTQFDDQFRPPQRTKEEQEVFDALLKSLKERKEIKPQDNGGNPADKKE